jgi:hypothetical protein
MSLGSRSARPECWTNVTAACDVRAAIEVDRLCGCVMRNEELVGIECTWVVPAGAKLEELQVIPMRAHCATCFVEATIDVSVHAPKAGQAQALARKALERELRSLGCGHSMPSETVGREALPELWFP